MYRRIAFAVLFVLCLIGVLARPMSAQLTNASLTGYVTDPSKGVIADAKVTAINVATNIRYETATDAAGSYHIPNLPPGTYRIEVEKLGFKTVVKSDVVLHVQDSLAINFEMGLGSTAETVTVTGGAPLVETVSSSVGDIVDSHTVVDLPLNGRSWTDLATLQPGVNAIHSQPPATGPDRGQRGLGDQVTISGTRPQQNTYLLDGINVQDYSNGGPGSVTGGSIGVDAIQEFAIFTSNNSAQYGRTSGGVVNAITRSGGNQFHGTLYEFLRNSALDARNYFDATIPPFRRNQFGVSGSGPIKTDKTFIFGNYEGLRQNLGITQPANVPSAALRSGKMCAPPDCSTTTPINVDPQVARYLNAFYPLPNGALLCPFTSCPTGAGDTGVFSFAGSQIITENYFTSRVDHNFSENNTLTGTYFFDDALLSQNDEFNNKTVSDQTRRQFATISESHIFTPSLLNVARIGYNRVSAMAPGKATPINPAVADISFGFVPGDSAGQIHVPGLMTFSGGLSPSTPLRWHWNSWQAYDDVTLTKGIHSLKFGANVERIEDNLFGTPHPGGRFFFNSLSDFMSNIPASFSTDLPGGISTRGIRQTVFGIYVQDDLRVSRNLTVNVGLRYEMATVPTEINNKLSSLLNITDAQPHLGAPLFHNPTLHNFEPRVGFSWDPFRRGKTAVRGAFGIFDVLPLPIELAAAITNSAPFYTSGSTSSLQALDFPTNAFTAVANNPNASRLTFVEQNPKRNYVMQWNLNIQQEITPTLALMVAYVGSRGIHDIFQADDANIVLPTLTSIGYVWPSPAGSGHQLNPNVGRLPVTLWNSDSYYHGLQMQLTKRLSHGLQGQVSYTWAKNIDTGSGSGYSDPYANSITSLFFFNPRLRRGLADTNVGQTLTANYIWRIPTPRSASGILEWALGGWQWGGLLTLSGGTPFTPLVGGDPLGLNSTDPYAYPDRVAGPGCDSPIHPGNVNNYINLACFAMPPSQGGNPPNFTRLGTSGRNDIVGPGLMTYDMSLFKDHLIPVSKVSDRLNVQFRAEFFNILNHHNFQSPIANSTLFNPDGTSVGGAGMIDTTTTSAREIQFGIKVIW